MIVVKTYASDFGEFSLSHSTLFKCYHVLCVCVCGWWCIFIVNRANYGFGLV